MPEPSEIHKAAELLEQFPTAERVRERLLPRLSALTHDMTKLPKGLEAVLASLDTFRDRNAVNARVLELAPIVIKGLRDPALYVEVLVDGDGSDAGRCAGQSRHQPRALEAGGQGRPSDQGHPGGVRHASTTS